MALVHTKLSPWHRKIPEGWTFREYSRYRRARLLAEARQVQERASLKSEINTLLESLRALTTTITRPMKQESQPRMATDNHGYGTKPGWLALLLLLSTSALLITSCTTHAQVRVPQLYDTTTEMVTRFPGGNRDVLMATGGTVKGDGLGGVYVFMPSSTAATNTLENGGPFKPLLLNGRLVKVLPINVNDTNSSPGTGIFFTLNTNQLEWLEDTTLQVKSGATVTNLISNQTLTHKDSGTNVFKVFSDGSLFLGTGAEDWWGGHQANNYEVIVYGPDGYDSVHLDWWLTVGATGGGGLLRADAAASSFLLNHFTNSTFTTAIDSVALFSHNPKAETGLYSSTIGNDVINAAQFVHRETAGGTNTTVFLVLRNSGYAGGGTKLLSDDGTYKAASTVVNVNSTQLEFEADLLQIKSGATVTNLIARSQLNFGEQTLNFPYFTNFSSQGDLHLRKYDAGDTIAAGWAQLTLGNISVLNRLLLNRANSGWQGGPSGTIPATTPFRTVSGTDASYTLTATPTISSPTPGQLLFLQGSGTDTNSITVQDESVLTGSGLELGATTRELRDGRTLGLLYNSIRGTWKEIFWSEPESAVNPTSGYLPYNNAGVFGDSPWYRIGTDRLGFNSTNYFLYGTAEGNVAMGPDALRSTTTNWNIAIGEQALQTATIAKWNVAIGSGALSSITSADVRGAIGIGSDSLGLKTSGTWDTAIGHNSMAAALTTSQNSAFGAESLRDLTSGINNVAIGYTALNSLSGASGSNTAVGARAGLSAVSTDGNTLIGTSSIEGNLYGSGNTAVGSGNFIYTTNIANSVILGKFSQSNAEPNIDVMTNNIVNSIFVGYRAQSITNNLPGLTNVISISYNKIPTANNQIVLGNNDNNVIVFGGVSWHRGTGTPEAAVTATIGSFYSREDGGAGTSFYVKESGTGNTGWVAK